MEAGEIRELQRLINPRNKIQELREHVWEIAEFFSVPLLLIIRIGDFTLMQIPQGMISF